MQAFGIPLLSCILFLHPPPPPPPPQPTSTWYRCPVFPCISAEGERGGRGGRESHGQRKQLRCGAPARSRLLFMPYMIKHSLWEGGRPMIVHQEQLFVSCTDCGAVFYALGFGGFLPVGPLTAPPPPRHHRSSTLQPLLYPRCTYLKG